MIEYPTPALKSFFWTREGFRNIRDNSVASLRGNYAALTTLDIEYNSGASSKI